MGTVVDVAKAPALSPRELQYLAGIHRALLFAALGAAGVAFLDGVFKPTPARLDAMLTEALRLQHLVEDLRTLSLADAGELPMQRVSVSPTALLERLAAAYKPRAEAANFEMPVSVERGLPDVCADPERMIQVLGNLVGNVLRYTPPGECIVLSARRRAAMVALTVQDQGTGIPPDVLAHIFDRFYRGDSARSQQDAESGPGIAIAKSITVAHGGKIEAQSGLGQGSAFTVLLPAT